MFYHTEKYKKTSTILISIHFSTAKTPILKTIDSDVHTNMTESSASDTLPLSTSDELPTRCFTSQKKRV